MFVLVIYVWIWSSARTDMLSWVRSIELEDGEREADVSANQVTLRIMLVLLTSWAWLVLFVLLLVVLQNYVLTFIRSGPSVSRNGTLLAISFRSLARGSVLNAVMASLLFTFVFTWVATSRALAGQKKKKKTKQTLRQVVSQSLTFNLVIVITGLLLCGVATPAA